jgi:hypothetical protein
MVARPTDATELMLTFVRGVTSVALGLIAVVASRASAQDDPDPTLVGIMRADGVVVPIAKFDKGKWAEFPGSSDEYRVPDRSQLPRTWAFHAANGNPRRVIDGGESVEFVDNGGNGYETWGQITTFPSRNVGPPNSYPIDHVGVTVSGEALNARVTTFIEGNPRSTTWQVNRREIERAFRRSADTLARGLPALRLRYVYTARQNVDGAQLFYVDAIASPTKEESSACPRAVYYQAWFRRAPNNQGITVVHDSVGDGHDCDSPGAQPATNIPGGVVSFAGRWFVVMDYIFYEGSSRQVLELTRTSLTPAHDMRH